MTEGFLQEEVSVHFFIVDPGSLLSGGLCSLIDRPKWKSEIKTANDVSNGYNNGYVLMVISEGNFMMTNIFTKRDIVTSGMKNMLCHPFSFIFVFSCH